VNVLKFPKGKPFNHGRKSVVRGLLEPAFENPKRMAGGDPGLF